MFQLSTKAVKPSTTKKRLSHNELKDTKQSKRGKTWERTNKRLEWESVDA